MPAPAPSAATALATHDSRTVFERTLHYGQAHGVLDAQRLDALSQEAPKGMVQIARYFGTEYLRPELELARQRLVNLVSLQLERECGGDLHAAALSLRTHSLLSRSKAASDWLRQMLVLPQNTLLGLQDEPHFTPALVPVLARWTLCAFSDVQAEWEQRRRCADLLAAAHWFAQHLNQDAEALQDCGQDAESVVRTALLLVATRRTQFPDWNGFERLILALRKHAASRAHQAPALPVPPDMPDSLHAAVGALRDSVRADWPTLLDPALSVRALFAPTSPFAARYFWCEDPLAEVHHQLDPGSTRWQKLTQGHHDDGTLLTLFLCLAAQTPPKSMLTTKSAASLIRRMRKHGLQPQLTEQFVRDHAPAPAQADFLRLWRAFLREARPTLTDTHDGDLREALSVLREACHVSA